MKKTLLIFFVGVILGWSYVWLTSKNDNTETDKGFALESIKETEIKRDEIVGTEKVKEIPKEIEEDVIIPENIKIDVPFTSQAPFGVWDERHEEACEEASLLMVAKYLTEEKLTPEISEKELQDMIDYQVANYGDYKDSNMEELVQLAEDFYEIKNLKVIYDFKKEDIKKELAKGNPIIVPTAGRLLGNPYFTPPGPLYHNLVLIGYDGNTIITNDPGTKRGEGYIYNIDILYDAIHDFTGKKEDIKEGKKAMIIISK